MTITHDNYQNKQLENVVTSFEKKMKTYDFYDFSLIPKVRILERFSHIIVDLKNNKGMKVKEIKHFFNSGVEIDGEIVSFDFSTQDFYNVMKKLKKQNLIK